MALEVVLMQYFIEYHSTLSYRKQNAQKNNIFFASILSYSHGHI